MITVKIVNKDQSVKDTIDGETYTLNKGVTEIPISFWIGYKNSQKKIGRSYIFPEDECSELSAIKEFKESCFSEFDSLGTPAVKASTEKGALSKGVKHSFALEWLESITESRELSRESREKESLHISREASLNAVEANKLARRAVIWAAFAVLISTIALVVK
ncbi:MAG: hypothetical protein V7765_17090 [Oleispira sp.]